jgi:hypothetical protein
MGSKLQKLTVSQYLRGDDLPDEETFYRIKSATIEPNSFGNQQLVITFVETLPDAPDKHLKWSVVAKTDTAMIMSNVARYLNKPPRDVDTDDLPGFGLGLVRTREASKRPGAPSQFVYRVHVDTVLDREPTFVQPPSRQQLRAQATDTTQVEKFIKIMREEMSAPGFADAPVNMRLWVERYGKLSAIAKSCDIKIPAEISTVGPENTLAVAELIVSTIARRAAGRDADGAESAYGADYDRPPF